VSLSAFAQETHRFNYEGFAIRIADDASDENGNHLLVGSISAEEPYAVDRDTMINRIFELTSEFTSDSQMGIVIATDKNYKVLRIGPSYIGRKVIYNSATKLFTVGAGDFTYLEVGDKSFSAWRPVIMEMDLNFKGKSWFVQQPYSCILENMVMDDDEIIIFTRSNIETIGQIKTNERAEVMRLSTSHLGKDSLLPWLPVLEPISRIQTQWRDIGRMTISDVSEYNGAWYFATSNLDQSVLRNEIHLYKVQNDTLFPIPYFSEYLHWSLETEGWIDLNDVFIDSTGMFSILCHKAASKDDMAFSITDSILRPVFSARIPLDYYGDFNSIRRLRNGNYVVLGVDEAEEWAYTLYSPKMEFIKEISSGLSKFYNPGRVKELEDGRVRGLFYRNGTGGKDCVLQVVGF
jgi:hypothetical protein